MHHVLTEPYVPYTVEVSASTDIGEGAIYSAVEFTEHGGKSNMLNQLEYVDRKFKSIAHAFKCGHFGIKEPSMVRTLWFVSMCMLEIPI